MTKNYIPTINITSLIKNNFETRNAFETIKKIETINTKFVFSIESLESGLVKKDKDFS